MHVLDHAAWASLTGPHAPLAERKGQAARYPADVSPFHALSPDADAAAWADLAALAGPGELVVLVEAEARTQPDDWERLDGIPGVQLTGEDVAGEPYPEAVRLTEADVPEMLALVRRTRPGPFLQRTIELGTYLGIRREGALIAMAGERLHPPGWTEISAVCTDPAFRGQGLGTRLVLAVVHGVRERGEAPFLHAAAANTGAIRLYEQLGFRLRLRPTFRSYRTPGHPVR